MAVDAAAKRRPVSRGRGRFWQDYNIEAREHILVLAEAGAHDPLEAIALNSAGDLAAAHSQAQAGLSLVARARQHRDVTVAHANRVGEDVTEFGRYGQALAPGEPGHAAS